MYRLSTQLNYGGLSSFSAKLPPTTKPIIMSQDSIFNVQPGGDTPEQPNPFQPLTESGENGSPFASVQADETPFGAVSEEAALPEPRAVTPAKKAAAQDNPFQLVDQAEPAAQQDSPFSTVDRGNAGSPFEMTGLGVGKGNGVATDFKGAQVNGARPNGFAAEENAGTPFAGVEAPIQEVQHHAALDPVQDFAEASHAEPTLNQVAPQVDEVGAFQIPREDFQAQPPQQQPAQNQGYGSQQTRPSTRASGATRQLELRAIFGVNHELTRDEILQRARSLPGVRNISVVDPAGARALEVLQSTINQIGFADGESVGLHCPGGMIDFITEGGATVAVLHEGEYAAGVCETLIIACREISKLG